MSRTLSTPLFEAASISTTSTARPSAISTQGAQAPHGSGVGPFSQLSAFATRRAVVVLPTPRGPVNRNACAICPRLQGVRERPDDVLLPGHLPEALGPVLPGEDEVGHCDWGSARLPLCFAKGSRAPPHPWLLARAELAVKRAGPQSPGARRTTYRCSLPGLAGFGNPHVARGFWAGSPGRCRRLDSHLSNARELGLLAERVGFEPTVPFPVHTISSRAPSTARSPLQIVVGGLRPAAGTS